MQIRARTCSYIGVYAHARTRVPVRVETKVLMGYGRLTVRARHTYLMDFRRYTSLEELIAMQIRLYYTDIPAFTGETRFLSCRAVPSSLSTQLASLFLSSCTVNLQIVCSEGRFCKARCGQVTSVYRKRKKPEAATFDKIPLV